MKDLLQLTKTHNEARLKMDKSCRDAVAAFERFCAGKPDLNSEESQKRVDEMFSEYRCDRDAEAKALRELLEATPK